MRALGAFITCCFALSVFFFFTTLPANAHKLKMFVTLEALSPHSKKLPSKSTGYQIKGQVYFSSTVPLADAEIKILSLQGREIGVTRTDQEGRFQWALKNVQPFKVQCQSIDGHLIERLITPKLSDQKEVLLKSKEVRNVDKTERETGASSFLKAEELRHILSSELTPLKEQISKLHHKIWLLEILAGLGLLFGGFGIWMFVLSKQAAKKNGEV